MNKSATIIWWDDEVFESYKLCLEPYGIKVLNAVATENFGETEITVYGPNDNIDRFLEDFDDDALEPFESLSLKYEDDDEYYAALNESVENFNFLVEAETSW